MLLRNSDQMKDSTDRGFDPYTADEKTSLNSDENGNPSDNNNKGLQTHDDAAAHSNQIPDVTYEKQEKQDDQDEDGRVSKQGDGQGHSDEEEVTSKQFNVSQAMHDDSSQFVQAMHDDSVNPSSKVDRTTPDDGSKAVLDATAPNIDTSSFHLTKPDGRSNTMILDLTLPDVVRSSLPTREVGAGGVNAWRPTKLQEPPTQTTTTRIQTKQQEPLSQTATTTTLIPSTEPQPHSHALLVESTQPCTRATDVLNALPSQFGGDGSSSQFNSLDDKVSAEKTPPQPSPTTDSLENHPQPPPSPPPPPLFSPAWQQEGVFDFFGGSLQGAQSDVELRVPEGAVPKDASSHVTAAICIDLDLIRSTLAIPITEHIVSPLVEYQVEVSKSSPRSFLKPVQVCKNCFVRILFSFFFMMSGKTDNILFSF
jgi:hypothetical protein